MLGEHFFSCPLKLNLDSTFMQDHALPECYLLILIKNHKKISLERLFVPKSLVSCCRPFHDLALEFLSFLGIDEPAHAKTDHIDSKECKYDGSSCFIAVSYTHLTLPTILLV